MTTYTTETLDSTEHLAIAITQAQYASGQIDHPELERRVEYIIGLRGATERARILHTYDTVDITSFGDLTSRLLPTAWSWPKDTA